MGIPHFLHLRDTNIVVVDGLMGTGKTKFTTQLRADLARLGIPSGVVSVDDDCPSREERNGKSAIDWHGKDLIPAALDVFLAGRGAAGVSGLMYNTASGRKDLHRTITVPDAHTSVLIIEGITVLEQVMQVVSATRNGTNLVCPIYLACEEEERNRRRRLRDAKKGLSDEEIERRIRTQQLDQRCFERDTIRDRFMKKRLQVMDVSR